jgi:hypothetical protein
MFHIHSLKSVVVPASDTNWALQIRLPKNSFLFIAGTKYFGSLQPYRNEVPLLYLLSERQKNILLVSIKYSPLKYLPSVRYKVFSQLRVPS